MLMHADQAGNYCLISKIHALHAGRDRDLRRRTYWADFAFGDHDRLIFPRSRARAIDHANVFERNQRSVHRDEWPHSRIQGILRHQCGRTEKNHRSNGTTRRTKMPGVTQHTPEYTLVREPRCYPNGFFAGRLQRHAKSVIRVAELRRNAAPGSAARDLDVVPPGAAA